MYRYSKTREGFTLVELLTSIGIIVLLVGILVPAVNSVRTAAKKVSSNATIQTLALGMESFRASERLGGLYPPSVSDRIAGGVTYNVSNPYKDLPNGPSSTGITISGAGLMVWALAGADLLGTPGFRAFRDSTANPNQFWSSDTDTNAGRNPGAYGIDRNTSQPLRKRVAPFVELGKVQVSSWNANAETSSGRGSFEIPAEVEAAAQLDQKPPQRKYPMFLDAFGQPIMYWRADPTGIRMADDSPNDYYGNPRATRGSYHFRDNGVLLDSGIGGKGARGDVLLLHPTTDDQPHEMTWPRGFGAGPQGLGAGDPPDAGWVRFILNKSIQAKMTPYNRDSFLLISAGADGIFGSGDDVANFPHNGVDLPVR